MTLSIFIKKESMSRWIYLWIGGNIWNSHDIFDSTKAFLEEENIRVVRESKRYISSPMYFTNQDSFLNSIIEIETNISPEELLKICKKCESLLWRKKNFRNGPRIIDLDILIYKDVNIQSNSLTIPHPKIKERDFVIFPFYDLEPELYINWEKIEAIKEKMKNSDIKVSE